jgi:hypothetical protein
LPILDPPRCGAPVVVRADTHIGADVSKCSLKARSQQDMADKIYELPTNAGSPREIIERGLEYSQQFTSERTVQDTLKVCLEAMSYKQAIVMSFEIDHLAGRCASSDWIRAGCQTREICRG